MSESDLTSSDDLLQAESGFLNVVEPRTSKSLPEDPRSVQDLLEYKINSYLANTHGSSAAGRWESRTAATVREGSSGAEVPCGPSNTRLYTSHDNISPSFFDSSDGGFDWLEATVYGHFSEKYAELVPKLEKAKAAASELGSPIDAKIVGVGPTMEAPGGQKCEILSYLLHVSSKGHRWGNTFMHYIVEYNGIKISLAKPGQKDDCPVCKIQIGSLALMRDSAQGAWQEALKLCEYLGITVERNTVSRVDLCVDLAGIDMIPFAVAILKGEVIKRIKSGMTPHFGPDGYCETIDIGRRGHCMVSIYDKLRELAANPNEDMSIAKTAELITRRWGYLPDKAVRIEFKVWGKWLKQKWTIRSVEDLFGGTRALLDYLTGSFFRLVDGPVDRLNNNQKRAVVSPLWEKIVSAFITWAGEKIDELEEKKPELQQWDKLSDDRRAQVIRAAEERRVMRVLAPLVQVASMCPDYVNSLDDLADLAQRIVLCYGEWPRIQRKMREIGLNRRKNGTADMLENYCPPSPLGFAPCESPVPF